MKKPDPVLFLLQQTLVDFSLINRNHFLAGTERRENDSEHSLSVAMFCWFIVSTNNVKLDLSKILAYALAHDLVEVYAGDINAFASDEDRKNKIKTERLALEKLSQQFKDFPDMISAMRAYETKADDEAWFVWTVDKIQALIMGDLDNWRPYQELHISYQRFCEKYQQQLAECSPYCKDIFNTVIEYCKTTYYDQPT